jgi:hypothetical protein
MKKSNNYDSIGEDPKNTTAERDRQTRKRKKEKKRKKRKK